MTKFVGIDLGTTYSAIAHMNDTGKPELIRNFEGDMLTPSVICFSENPPLIGREARQLQSIGDAAVAAYFKRMMGNSSWRFCNGDHQYSPVDLSTLILQKLKNDAEMVLKESVSHAVITVPAYFSDAQRRDTITAGENAGLQVLRIINEPTAAAIEFGIEKLSENDTVLVYDLGGGTFDVTVIKSRKNGLEVLATDGNHELGGKDWDDIIMRYAAEKFKAKFEENPLEDPECLNTLMIQAENLKKSLSTLKSARMTLHCAGASCDIQMSREQFAGLSEHLLQTTIHLCEAVLSAAGLSWQQLTGILCVGGASRMPMVGDRLSSVSGRPILSGIDVDEAVARGAAIQAYNDYQDIDVVPAAAHWPTGKYALPPGAIHDVMSHSLGMIAISEDRQRYVNSVLIPKNRSIPATETRPFQYRTNRQNTTELEVYITQGEGEDPLACQIIGKYCFGGFRENKKDLQRLVEITYAYDRNGVVQVSAVEQPGNHQLTPGIDRTPGELAWLGQRPDERIFNEPLSICIALDLSGSMGGKPLRKAREAARLFIERLNLRNTAVSIVAVAESVEVIQPLTHNSEALNEALDSLEMGMVGYANTAEPFAEIYRMMATLPGMKVAIVLADGMWSFPEVAVREARKCHNANIEVIAVGFGSADHYFLKSIATSDDNAMMTDLKRLAGSFDKIAQVLSGEAELPKSANTKSRLKLPFLNLFQR